MIPWIQVYSNILTHDKTYALAEKLKIQNYAAVGIMVSLWAWASVNATDGDISRYPPRAIADATGYSSRKPEDFYAALVDTRLIEKLEDGRTVIRNWEEYAALLIDLMENQKKKTADRVRKHRDRQKQKGTCNVTETLRNALPNTTIPNLTKPNLSPTGENTIFFDDVVDKDRVQSVEAVENFLESRSLTLDAYIDMTESIKVEAQQITESIFQKFTNRTPTQQDIVNVFGHTCKRSQVHGEWTTFFDKEAINLLLYAFEQSNMAGCPGAWAYISGVMRRLKERGIKTLEAAEGYDFDRDQKKGHL